MERDPEKEGFGFSVSLKVFSTDYGQQVSVEPFLSIFWTLCTGLAKYKGL